MPTTIHVTIQDHSEALAVVATLLNQRYEVSIDLDVVAEFVEPNYMSREEVAVRDRLWDAKARGDIKHAERDAKKRKIADARKVEAEPITWAVPADDPEYFDQQERQRRHDMRYAEALDAQVVECTACGAMVGDWCRTPKGGRYKTFVHADRVRAFHTFKNQ